MMKADMSQQALTYSIIANPSARSGGSSAAMRKALEQALAKHGISYDLYWTTGKGNAMELARQVSAQPEDTVLVVLGGDGTINEVLNGIQDFSRVRLGFLPAGSSNDLARGLKLHDIDTLIQRICAGSVIRTIDLGILHYDHLPKMKDRIFAISCGIGYDAAICEEALHSRIKKFFNLLHQGKLSYGVIGAKQLFAAPSSHCEITLKDGTGYSADRMLFASVMNTPYEGGGYQFAPDALPDDSLLNLVMVGDIAKLNALIHFPSAHEGRYYHVKGVTHSMAERIHIETSTPLWVHTDGEVITKADSVSVSILPHRLNLIV